MAELIIRNGKLEDSYDMAEIEKLCFRTPWSKESIEKDLRENKHALYIVAELNHKVIAYLSVWNIIDEGHINNVAVSPLLRGQHIATILMETMINSTEAAGIKRHTLEVRESNTIAIKLYEKFGFYFAGIRKGYYEDTGENGVIMWRDSKYEGQ